MIKTIFTVLISIFVFAFSIHNSYSLSDRMQVVEIIDKEISITENDLVPFFLDTGRNTIHNSLLLALRIVSNANLFTDFLIEIPTPPPEPLMDDKKSLIFFKIVTLNDRKI